MLNGCATTEIIEDYEEIAEGMIAQQGHILRHDVLAPFIAGLELIAPRTKVQVSRNPDDDKFIGCALDAKARNIFEIKEN